MTAEKKKIGPNSSADGQITISGNPSNILTESLAHSSLQQPKPRNNRFILLLEQAETGGTLNTCSRPNDQGASLDLFVFLRQN